MFQINKLTKEQLVLLRNTANSVIGDRTDSFIDLVEFLSENKAEYVFLEDGMLEITFQGNDTHYLLVGLSIAPNGTFWFEFNLLGDQLIISSDELFIITNVRKDCFKSDKELPEEYKVFQSELTKRMGALIRDKFLTITGQEQ